MMTLIGAILAWKLLKLVLAILAIIILVLVVWLVFRRRRGGYDREV